MLTGAGVVRATDGAPSPQCVFCCIRRAELSGPLNNRFLGLVRTSRSTRSVTHWWTHKSMIKTERTRKCRSVTRRQDAGTLYTQQVRMRNNKKQQTPELQITRKNVFCTAATVHRCHAWERPPAASTLICGLVDPHKPLDGKKNALMRRDFRPHSLPGRQPMPRSWPANPSHRAFLWE